MSHPTALLVGGIGKLPHAGVSFYYLHYPVGLRELGYQVHHVERQDGPRRIAERHFEASVVIAEMLEAAGLR